MSLEITPKELQNLILQGNPPVLVDVREFDELSICALPNHIHIPLAQIPTRFSEIPKDKDVVVYCRSGGRSGNAVNFLSQNGYTKVKNLIGGMLRWSDDVDPSFTKY
jgi:rhodanese-related sulfurtransferase